MRIIGIDVPGFGVPTHAEAKDVLAGAMLRYARQEAEQGPVRRRAAARCELPTVTLIGEMFPGRPGGHRRDAGAAGPGGGPVVPTREWRELYAALDCAVGRGGASVLYRQRAANSRRPAGTSWLRAGRRRRHGGLAGGDRRCLRTCGATRSTPPRTAPCRRSRRRWRQSRSRRASRCRAMKDRNCWWRAC